MSIFLHLPGIVGDFRASQPDGSLRKDLCGLPEDLSHLRYIPQITGQAEYIRVSPVKIRQDLIKRLIDRIFRNGNLTFRIPFFCISSQTVYR